MDPVLSDLSAQFEPMLIYSLLISVACALVCGLIAARRRGRWIYWSVMGFAFGPFALPFVFFAKPKKPQKESS